MLSQEVIAQIAVSFRGELEIEFIQTNKICDRPKWLNFPEGSILENCVKNTLSQINL